MTVVVVLLHLSRRSTYPPRTAPNSKAYGWMEVCISLRRVYPNNYLSRNSSRYQWPGA